MCVTRTGSSARAIHVDVHVLTHRLYVAFPEKLFIYLGYYRPKTFRYYLVK